MYRGRRRPNYNPWVYYLALQSIFNIIQLPRKPPVTLFLIALNVAIFFRVGPIHELFPYTYDVCLNPYSIVQNLDIRRLLLSAFYHVDEIHLIYNMSSLLWKGAQLERRLGSAKFGAMVAFLLALSHGLVVAISGLSSTFTDWTQPYYNECAVGFSAVLFALKTVLNSSQPTHTYLHGLVIPTRYASWAELLFIQLALPQSSILGHLCGILAGNLYLRMPNPWSLALSFCGQTTSIRSFVRSFLNKYLRGQGRRLRDEREERSRRWNCQLCTYENHGASMVCEMCETPRYGGSSNANFAPSAPPWPEHFDENENGNDNDNGGSASNPEFDRDEFRQYWNSRFR